MCSSERHIGTFFVLFRTRMVGFCQVFRFFGSFFLAQNLVGRYPRCALGADYSVSDGPLPGDMYFQELFSFLAAHVIAPAKSTSAFLKKGDACH